MKKSLRLHRAGRALASAALIFLLSPTAYAQEHIAADRPGIADASTVIEPRSIQLESGVQWESRPADRVWFLPTLVRIGLRNRLEARIESNTWTAETNRGQMEYGIAPISIGAAVVLHPGYGVIARVFPAWGSGDFHASRVTGDLRLAMDFELPKALAQSQCWGGVVRDRRRPILYRPDGGDAVVRANPESGVVCRYRRPGA
jgi:hypothetical protein